MVFAAGTAGEQSPRPAIWGNRFGLAEAVLGFLIGELVGSIAANVADAASHHSNLAQDAGGLIGLWVGLVGAALGASLARRRPDDPLGGFARLRRDYGLGFKAVDAPLGIAVGLASSFLLVPLLTLPLAPFVPHLSQRLQQPANTLTNHIEGAGYVLLALLVCVGSPVVEELFFRGLVLRALLGRFGTTGFAGPAISVVVTGVVFGLAHFELFELLALAGFGMVLCLLALRTGRLGAGMFAHATFNAITIISLARTH